MPQGLFGIFDDARGLFWRAVARIVAQPNANAEVLGIRLKVGQTSGDVMLLIKLRRSVLREVET